MQLEVPCYEKLLRANRKYAEISGFLQRMMNRIIVGYFRYGGPNTGANYMTRMAKEMSEYKKCGNMEHLINIANYAFLESLEPENPKFHFDNTIKSAIRR